MMFNTNYQFAIAALAAIAQITSAQCPDLRADYDAPVLADGWEATLIANDLRAPRGIIFDRNGGLLVVDKGVGIVRYEFMDGGGGCLLVTKRTALVNSTTLNHGIALSTDGQTLYASSSENVYAWDYDAGEPAVSSTNRTMITRMSNGDHTTRTLLMSQKEPGTLLVSRGSDSNIDLETEHIESGRSQIKAFDVGSIDADSEPYDFTTSGRLLGWGLRNSVGVAEEPLTGGIYSVENSADEIERNGVDIHQNNPGEEMNFHGSLNSTENQGGNYGYPHCFAIWNTDVPDNDALTVGTQFSLDQSSTVNDTFCQDQHVAPRLTFQAHQAPLDIIFLPNGTEAFVAFHGSWNRDNPAGYKVSSIAFENGSPVANADSNTSTIDIFANADNSKCPKGCFRPVGLALDSKDRLIVSSDGTGELYVLVKRQSSSTSPSGTTPSGTSPTTSTSPTDTGGASIASLPSAGAWFAALLGLFAVL